MTITFLQQTQYSRETGYSGYTLNSTPPGLHLYAEETEQSTASITYQVLGGDVNLFEQRGNSFFLGSGQASEYFPLGVDFDHPVRGSNTYEIQVRATSTWQDGNYQTQSRTEVGTFQLVITDIAPPSLGRFANPTGDEGFYISEGTGGGRPVTSSLVATSNFGASSDAPGSDGGGLLVYTLIDNDGGNFEFYDVEHGGKWLRTTANADLQVGADGTASRYVTVQVTDGTTIKNATIEIHVNSVPPTAPTDADLAGNGTGIAGSVAENAAADSLVGITARSSDPGAAALRYSISSGQGFAIDPATGVITVSDPAQFNFEAAATRAVTVNVTDGVTTTFSTFNVAVGDVNEAPRIRFGEGVVFNATESVADVPSFIHAQDPDRGDVVSLSLAGADGELFRLDETSRLVFRTTPDYEQPQDANRDNIYDVTVVATDRAGLTDRRDVKIAVANVNEAPVIVTERLTVESGTSAIGRLQATDPDGDRLTFALTSGEYEAQGRYFLQSDGTVQFKRPQIYDSSTPANNVFDLPVTVTDRETGGLSVSKTVTVQVLAPGTGPSDTVPPASPRVRLVNDTGRSSSDHVTKDAQLTVTTAEPGGTLGYVIDGQSSASYDATRLAAGAHRIEVFQRDASGNASASSEISFLLDRDAPVLMADRASGTAGGAAMTGNVLTNDTDRLPLSVAAVRAGSGAEQALPTSGTGSIEVAGADGVLTLSADGTYSYRPTGGGTDVFTQTITDAAGNTSLTTLTFTVSAAPTDPVTPTPPTGGGGGGPTTPTTPTSPVVPSTGGTASPSAGQTQTVTGITSGALIVDGAGKVELTGTNTYTGPTTVEQGTLVVNGSIVSPVTVESGGTLGGSGSTGTVAVASGGTLSPGNSPGILSTKDLSLAAGAVLKQEIGGTASGQFDQLKVTGTVALSGATLDVSAFGGFASASGERFTIIDNDGADAVTGHFAGLDEGAVFGFGARSLRISYQGGDGNDVTLTDTTGLAFRPEAFGTVVTSADSQAGAVHGLYEALLDRAPDAVGLSGFVGALENGASLTQVAQAILASPEHGAQTQSPTAYVQSLYQNLLNRAADASGLATFEGELAAGVSQATVAAQIATSAEAKAVLAPAFAKGVLVADASEASVARLYYGLLDRAPDAGGLQAFSAFIENGGGGAAGEAARLGQVSSAILASGEYTGKNAGLSDAAFVFELYQDALGRAPDAGGASHFADALAHGVSRTHVALDITQSQEAQAHWFSAVHEGTLLVA